MTKWIALWLASLAVAAGLASALDGEWVAVRFAPDVRPVH